MVAALDKYRLAYFPVPKIASTSMKHALGMIAAGVEFDDSFNKVHNRWPTGPLKPADFEPYRGYTCFTIVRDPIERIISYHYNRLRDIRRKQSNWAKYGAKHLSYRLRGLPLKPSLEEFVLHFEGYLQVERNTWPHTCSMSEYIGHDIGYFDLVAKMDNLGPVVDLIQRKTGHTIDVPVRNRNKDQPAGFESLSGEAQRRLIDMTGDDYRLLGDFLKPPEPTNPPISVSAMAT